MVSWIDAEIVVNGIASRLLVSEISASLAFLKEKDGMSKDGQT